VNTVKHGLDDGIEKKYSNCDMDRCYSAKFLKGDKG